ncbi:MAG: hypothetical protein GY774_39970 [Planctomycetes bacterium]|nr:hypothetical protein [Planctomycetota bacterium]
MSLDNIVSGDYGQTIVLTVKDTDTDAAADISAYTTTIQMQISDPDGNVATETATFVTDGSNGQVQYTLTDGDIDEIGVWRIRAKVTSGSAVLSSVWERFTVNKAA